MKGGMTMTQTRMMHTTCGRFTLIGGLSLLIAISISPNVAAYTTPTALVIATGETAGDRFGNSVGTAGDVNGDGYADVIVGASLNGTGGALAGRAYVYFGGPSADAVADLTLTGAAAAERFGYSVGTAGDVNGDGYSDVIVGAIGNGAAGMNAGRAYVYFGGPAPDALPDLTLTGEAAGDWFGRSVGTAGDVNGDGYADVIVGADQNDVGGTNAGRAYVYFGGPAADAVADLTLTGEVAGDFFGGSVGTSGDVNGDGYADLIVGASLNDAGGTTAGRAYVYFGGPAADAVADLTLTGEMAGDMFGYSVGAGGDVNGDGYGDVIVGARGNSAGGASAGRAYVFFGGTAVDGAADLVLTGAAVGDQFGWSAGTAGDIDGDGYADLVVGAPFSDAGGTDAGRMYVYLGGPGADAVPDLILIGEGASDFFGTSVGTAGDVNGDGHADVIVGASRNDAGGTDAGRAYVFGVKPPTLPVTLDLDPDVINLKSRAPWVTAYIEPVGFHPGSINVSTLRLAGSVPTTPKSAIVGDHNKNGAPDLMVKFSRDALDPLLTVGVNELKVTGSLVTGEDLKGSDEIRVIDPPDAPLSVSIAPNPLNPAGALTFRTKTPGPVTVKMFDLHGRLVRSLAEAPLLPAGVHEFRIDGRGERGQTLASGLYFYRVETADGIVTGRIAILK